MNCQEITKLITETNDLFKDFINAFNNGNFDEAISQSKKIDRFVENRIPERQVNWERVEILDKIDIAKEYNNPVQTAAQLTKINNKVWLNITLQKDSWKDLLMQLNPRNGKREKIKIDILENAEDFTDNIAQLSKDFIAVELFGSKHMAVVDLKSSKIIQESSPLEGDERSIICANGWLVSLRSDRIYAWKVNEDGNINPEPDVHQTIEDLTPEAEIVPLGDGEFVFCANRGLGRVVQMIYNPNSNSIQSNEISLLSKVNSVSNISDSEYVVADGGAIYMVNKNQPESPTLLVEDLSWETKRIIILPDGKIARGIHNGAIVISEPTAGCPERTILQKSDKAVRNLCYANGVLYSSHEGGVVLKWGEKKQ